MFLLSLTFSHKFSGVPMGMSSDVFSQTGKVTKRYTKTGFEDIYQDFFLYYSICLNLKWIMYKKEKKRYNSNSI